MKQNTNNNNFFTKTTCDRCGQLLTNGRIMSMYNEECICLNCKREEEKRSDYQYAVDSIINAHNHNDFNFKGIGLKNNKH